MVKIRCSEYHMCRQSLAKSLLAMLFSSELQQSRRLLFSAVDIGSK